MRVISKEASRGDAEHNPVHPVLTYDKVRFVGDRVAFVGAETLAQARDTAELVRVGYEPLRAAPLVLP